MKPFLASCIAGFASLVVVVSFAAGQHPSAAGNAGALSAHGGAAAPAAAGESGATTGKVIETMNASSYTYVQVDDGSKRIWAAAPQFTVAVGDKVVVPAGSPMPNFQSKSLGRTFDVVYFVSGIQVVGGAPAKAPAASAATVEAQVAAAHGAAAATPPAAKVDLTNIKKAEGGQTVAEVFANKAGLANKEVVVRGRVVKFTPQIMGKNWIHLQDGTGAPGSNDLTVTTSANAAVGNLVLVRGKLSTEKDFGFGYHYDALVEDATVGVE